MQDLMKCRTCESFLQFSNGCNRIACGLTCQYSPATGFQPYRVGDPHPSAEEKYPPAYDPGAKPITRDELRKMHQATANAEMRRALDAGGQTGPRPFRGPRNLGDACVTVGGSALGTQVGGGHYKDMPIQPVEYIVKNDIGFVEGAVIKYVSRWRKKAGVEDLKKARHMLDLLIEMEEKK